MCVIIMNWKTRADVCLCDSVTDMTVVTWKYSDVRAWSQSVVNHTMTLRSAV